MDGPLRQLGLDDLRSRTSSKWRRFPPDVLPLWVAEMDCVLAEPVVATVGEAMARGDTGYAFGGSYKEAAAAFAEDRWGWRPSVADSRMVPDVMRGAVEVLRMLTDDGDGVVVNPPVYPPFFSFLAHGRRDVVSVPLGAGGRLDLGALAAAFARPEVTGFLLCSPHNPTGVVHTAAELREVARLADHHGVAVVADEIHAPLTAAGVTFVPYLSLDEAASGVALHSASKAFNLAGLKAAVAFAGGAAAPRLAAMPRVVGDGISHVGIRAHVAAYREGGGWLDHLLDDLDENRRLFGELLAEHLPEVPYRAAEGTYLAWLDVRPLGLGEDPAAAFLEHGRVAFNAGHTFGAGGAGHVRVNLATTPAILTEAVARMAATVATRSVSDR